MRRIATTGLALVALLAIGATAATGASAEKLTLSVGGTALEPGPEFEIYDSGDALRVETSKGFLGCEESFTETGLEVSPLTNSKKVDELQIKRIFGGSFEPCRSFTGNADLELRSLGDVLKLRANGKASVGPVSLRITYEHIEFEQEVECFYRHGLDFNGTNTATTSVQPLQVEFEGELRLDHSRTSASAVHLCPTDAELSLSLPLTRNETEEGFHEQTHT